jgi:hypothetical protein
MKTLMGALACNLRPGHSNPLAADTHQSTLHFPPYKKKDSACPCTQSHSRHGSLCTEIKGSEPGEIWLMCIIIWSPNEFGSLTKKK